MAFRLVCMEENIGRHIDSEEYTNNFNVPSRMNGTLPCHPPSSHYESSYSMSLKFQRVRNIPVYEP